jgi:cyanophycinase
MIPSPGIVALAGSGEFTPSLAPLDRYLLRDGGRVVALTQASAPDGAEAQLAWAERAQRHFAELGIDVATPIVRSLGAAADPEIPALIEDASLVWLSGGDPLFLRDSLVPLRGALTSVLRRGAAIAGSSAGAMALGSCTLPRLECGPEWQPGLGLLPDACIVPHLGAQPAPRLAAMLASAPDDLTVVGIDEDTALLLGGDAAEAWGRGSVTFYRGGEAVGTMRAPPALADVLDAIPDGHGPVGLLSSDEFLPHVAPFDRALAEACGPRIALLLCANPAEADHQARQALEHFARLGASPFVVDVMTRTQALDATLPEYDLLYLGGGSPSVLLECLHATPLWDEALRRWAAGAGLAGSSAGAMALCRDCLVPVPGADKPTRWAAGLGPLSCVGLAVHVRTRPKQWLDEIAASAPAPVLAIDDATGVLLRAGTEPGVYGAGRARIRPG